MRLTYKDLKNKRFGRLIAIKHIGSKGQGTKKSAIWECICDCGTKKTVVASHLTSGHTKSCGCLKKDRLLKYNKSRKTIKTASEVLFRDYIWNAKRRNIEFKLTSVEFFKITKENCHYCGAKPFSVKWITWHKGRPYKYNGIDRKNNKVGYVKNNVVACCSHCNWSKHTMTEIEFLKTVKRIYLYQNKRRPKWINELQ